jgi:TatD family-associated radical SAM protein
MTQPKPPKTVYWLDNTLYLNITNKCANNCYFCIKHYRTGVGGFNLKLQNEPTLAQVIGELSEVLHDRAWDGLVFCGFGEPTSRLDMLLTIAKWVRANYGRALQIRLDTNGQGTLLNPNRDVAFELKDAGVDTVSVSLNAADKETYNEICRPTYPDAYEVVLDFICKAKSILHVEVSAVRLPEVDIPKVSALAQNLDVSFKVREYIPCFF